MAITVLPDANPPRTLAPAPGRVATRRNRFWSSLAAGSVARGGTATVAASTTATVWRIPGTVFLDALYHGASEPTALVEVMAERLARTS